MTMPRRGSRGMTCLGFSTFSKKVTQIIWQNRGESRQVYFMKQFCKKYDNLSILKKRSNSNSVYNINSTVDKQSDKGQNDVKQNFE